MKLPLYQIDAFTSRMFGGNPAAVVLLDTFLPDRALQAIAAENNLAKTAFVVPHGEVMPLRWFTPTVEVDLCGHATLAGRTCPFPLYLSLGEALDVRDAQRKSHRHPRGRPSRNGFSFSPGQAGRDNRQCRFGLGARR
jgi:predicted PhzF superfamily epimerase YddE/YHI9